MSGYTYAEKLVLRDQHSLLTKKLSSHASNCLTCFADGQCWAARIVSDEIDSLAEALDYTNDSFSNSHLPSLVRDAESSDLVNTYIDTERKVKSDYEPEFFDPEADSWILSQEGQSAISDLTPYSVEQDERVLQDLTTNSLWEQVILWGPYDSQATEANLRAVARIWTTGRGEVGIYKTFIRNFQGDSTNWKFEAYCSDCKQSRNFQGVTRQTLTQYIISTIRHAHSHLPNSELRFDNSNVFIEGSNSLDLDSQSDSIEYLKKAADYELTYFRLKYRSNSLTSQELKLAKAWSSFSKEKLSA